MVEIGELRHRIKILELINNSSIYSWSENISVWAKYEEPDKTNLFSKIGIGVKTAKFTIRKCDLTLHNAIRFKENHFFLTNIAEVDRRYYEVTTACIESKNCVAKRNVTTLNELNRPVLTPQTVATFPACLVEKYLGYRQEKPHAVNDITYVMVTPKIIVLKTADLVKIGDDTYNVQIVHNLDEYKNEYEIGLNRDV
jgi:hypothetical protein